mmetsp:Transcript_11710/g.17050  ORF Transcript_11710/g.17050 Transcript_11710/m.17050 type:complete len:468 (+) Transcript_11710:144-1547(+)
MRKRMSPTSQFKTRQSSFMPSAIMMVFRFFLMAVVVMTVHCFPVQHHTGSTTLPMLPLDPSRRKSFVSSSTTPAGHRQMNLQLLSLREGNNQGPQYRNTYRSSGYFDDMSSNRYFNEENFNRQDQTPPVQSRTVTLSTWIEMEILYSFPSSVGSDVVYNSLSFREPAGGYGGFSGGNQGQKSPLVFIHGSFHAAWCWAEYYLPYFASMGYPAIALSLRGTSGSPTGKGVKKVSIDRHADDISSLLDYITAPRDIGGMGLGSNEGFARPVLIGHSFGGLYVMKYLERDSAVNSRKLGGVALLCSVPPSGNTAMTARTMKRSLKDSWDITSGLAMKQVTSDVNLCRRLFFGGSSGIDDMGISNADIRRYQKLFKKDSVVSLDLVDLQRKLPSSRTNNQGMAIYAYDLPPCLVVGASDDRIVDVEGVIESATYLGVPNPVFVESSHDVMLGRRWRNCADLLLQWLDAAVY